MMYQLVLYCICGVAGHLKYRKYVLRPLRLASATLSELIQVNWY